MVGAVLGCLTDEARQETGQPNDAVADEGIVRGEFEIWLDVDPELFSDFTNERVRGAFVGLNLAAGKLPQPTRRLLGSASADEYPLVVENHGRNNW